MENESKKFNKKLSLNKKTIAKLNQEEMKNVNGGVMDSGMCCSDIMACKLHSAAASAQGNCESMCQPCFPSGICA